MRPFRTHYAEQVRLTKIGRVDDDGPLTYIEGENERGERSEWMLSPRALEELRDLADSAIQAQARLNEPLFEYMIDDGEGPWVSDRLTMAEMEELFDKLGMVLTGLAEEELEAELSCPRLDYGRKE